MKRKTQSLGSCLLLLCLSLPIAALNAWLNPNSPPWNPMDLAEGEISLEQLLVWQGSLILVDARTPESYSAAHLPGAINLYAGEFDTQVQALLDRWSPDDTIIVYCDSRQCDASDAIAKRLREDFQMQQVFVLKGGWERWLSTSAEVRSSWGGDA